jgi:hypothetical protein
MEYKATLLRATCLGSILCDRSCIECPYRSRRHVMRRRHDLECQNVNKMGQLVKGEGTKTVACGRTM